jgi:hypothetical protein
MRQRGPCRGGGQVLLPYILEHLLASGEACLGLSGEVVLVQIKHRIAFHAGSGENSSR